jgi:hypothetical protein
MSWEPAPHPEWVTVFNQMGANVGTDTALVDLSEESLIAAPRSSNAAAALPAVSAADPPHIPFWRCSRGIVTHEPRQKRREVRSSGGSPSGRR